MNQTTLSELLKEYYYIGSLGERAVAKYHLINRYKDKVSQRLLREQEYLYKEW